MVAWATPNKMHNISDNSCIDTANKSSLDKVT